MSKTICPICGWEVDGNYNHDTSNTDFECEECGHTFTEECGHTFTHNDIKHCDECGKEINPHTDDVQHINGMTFCSTKCVEKWYGY